MHPVSNYMLNEHCVHGLYHYPGGAEGAEDTLREGGEEESHSSIKHPLDLA